MKKKKLKAKLSKTKRKLAKAKSRVAELESEMARSRKQTEAISSTAVEAVPRVRSARPAAKKPDTLKASSPAQVAPADPAPVEDLMPETKLLNDDGEKAVAARG